MAYINVGARVDGRRPASKKALREAVRDTPELVTFDSTALMGARPGAMITCTVADIGGDTLEVTGPDPYTSRKWYAGVKATAAGKLVVT